MGESIMNTEIDILPMKVVEDISSELNKEIRHDIDKDYNVVVFIDNLSYVSKVNKKYGYYITGYGKTYKEACLNFLHILMREDILLRFNEKYATTRIRNIIIKSGILIYYLLK